MFGIVGTFSEIYELYDNSGCDDVNCPAALHDGKKTVLSACGGFAVEGTGVYFESVQARSALNLKGDILFF